MYETHRESSDVCMEVKGGYSVYVLYWNEGVSFGSAGDSLACAASHLTDEEIFVSMRHASIKRDSFKQKWKDVPCESAYDPLACLPPT